MKKTLLTGVLLLIGISLIFTGCAAQGQGGNALQTYSATKMDLSSEVNLNGTVNFDPEVSVYSRTSGTVLNVYVSQGTKVSKGDKLLDLDATQAQANYQNANLAYKSAQLSYQLVLNAEKDLESNLTQAQFNLSSAEASYDFAKANYDSVSSNDKSTDLQIKQALQQLKQAEASLNSAKSSVDSAKRQIDNNKLKIEQSKIQVDQSNLSVNNALKSLNDFTIKAPINGEVLELPVAVGQTVSPNMPVAIIGNSSKYNIVAYADEIDVTKLEKEQKASVTFDELPNLKLDGIISSIGLKEITLQGASAFEVDVSTSATNSAIRSGFSANITVITNSKNNVLVVPISSIVTLANGKTYVDKVSDKGSVERVEVVTGIAGNVYVEIVSGLSEGDKVLIIPQSNQNNAFSQMGG
ncbi:MAG: efflux RND transporter periplasmic adaptor subunit [Caldisericaceae bacterium]